MESQDEAVKVTASELVDEIATADVVVDIDIEGDISPDNKHENDNDTQDNEDNDKKKGKKGKGKRKGKGKGKGKRARASTNPDPDRDRGNSVPVPIGGGQTLHVSKDKAYLIDRLVQQGVREGTLVRSEHIRQILDSIEAEEECENDENDNEENKPKDQEPIDANIGVSALRRRLKRERDRINRGRLQEVLAQAPGGGDGRDLDHFIHSIIDENQQTIRGISSSGNASTRIASADSISDVAVPVPDEDSKFTWPAKSFSSVASSMLSEVGGSSGVTTQVDGVKSEDGQDGQGANTVRSEASAVTVDDPNQRGWKKEQKRISRAARKRSKSQSQDGADNSGFAGGLKEKLRASSKKWWDPRRGRVLDVEGRISRGSSYVIDAFKRREAVNRPDWARQIYYISMSKLWIGFHSIVLLLHLSLAWFEPSSHFVYPSFPLPSQVKLLIWIELGCIAVHWIDMSMRFLHLGPFFFTFKTWNRIALIVLLVLTVDVILALFLPGGLPFRFSRFLRPILVLGRSKSLIDSSEAILRTLPNLRDLASFLFFIVVLYAIFGVMMFPEGTYPAGRNADTGMGMSNFDNIGNAMIAVFTLLTTENYPDIMYPTLKLNDWFFLFFISFLIIGVFVLLTVAVAIVFHSYKWHRRNTVLEDRIREREALELSFAYLDVNGDGKISKEMFSKVIDQIAPERPEFEVNLLFKACDEDCDDQLNLYEYFSVCDALLLRFSPVSVPGNMSVLPEFCASWFARFAQRKKIRALVSSKWFTRFSLALSVLHMAVFMLIGIPELTKQGDWLVILVSINMGFNILYMIEFSLYILGIGSFYVMRDPWMVFDLVILICTIASNIALLALGEAFLPLSQGSIIGHVLRAGSSLCLLRIIGRFEPFKSLLFTLAHVIPAVAAMGTVILVLFYLFAVIGQEILGGGKLSKFESFSDANPIANFDSMANSFVVLFQLVTLSNWHTVLYASIACVGYGPAGWGIAAFYVIFVTMVVLVFMNMLMALIIELFVALKEMLKLEEEEYVEVDDPTLVDSFYQAQKKMLKLKVTKDRRFMEDVEGEVVARAQAQAQVEERRPSLMPNTTDIVTDGGGDKGEGEGGSSDTIAISVSVSAPVQPLPTQLQLQNKHLAVASASSGLHAVMRRGSIDIDIDGTDSPSGVSGSHAHADGAGAGQTIPLQLLTDDGDSDSEQERAVTVTVEPAKENEKESVNEGEGESESKSQPPPWAMEPVSINVSYTPDASYPQPTFPKDEEELRAFAQLRRGSKPIEDGVADPGDLNSPSSSSSSSSKRATFSQLQLRMAESDKGKGGEGGNQGQKPRVTSPLAASSATATAATSISTSTAGPSPDGEADKREHGEEKEEEKEEEEVKLPKCKLCGSDAVQRKDMAANGKQRYGCLECGSVFRV